MRIAVATALGFALLFAVSAQAERRVALVIGNDDYPTGDNLKTLKSRLNAKMVA